MPSKKSKGPLLYINQPFSRNPSIKMQDVYTSKQETEQQEEDSLSVKQKLSIPQNEQEKIPISIEITNPENSQKKVPHSSFNRVKSFKEMDIKERLEYLINFPRVLPPVPCVFYTTDKNYQGYLIKYDEENITIEFHDKITKTLSVQEIQDIIMIGIKK